MKAALSGLARAAAVADGWRVTEDSEPRRDRRVFLLLWLLPLWLVVSSLVGLWIYLGRKSADEDDGRMRFATAVSETGLRDDVGKLLGFVGERHPASPTGVQGLNRAAAMIEGSLGAGNAGYRVERVAGPSLPAGRWPLLVVSVQGKEEDLPPLWVVAAYDARAGSPGAEANASGVASVLAAAQANASRLPLRPVSFAFLPHGYGSDDLRAEVAAIFQKRAGTASAVLVVESMGAGEKLLLSGSGEGRQVLGRVGDLGEVRDEDAAPAEGQGGLFRDLSSRGLPAVRVATRPEVKGEESDDTPPDPALHAAATAALSALIQRLSDS